MKKLILLAGGFFFLAIYAQTTCSFSNGKTVTFPGQPLCAFKFPSDTTDQLYTTTHIAITPDSLFYADVLTYQQRPINLLLVSVAMTDMKRDFNFTIDQVKLTPTDTAFLLQMYTSVNHNVFLNDQENWGYGYTSIPGNVINIVCCTRQMAEEIVRQIDQRLKAK